MADFLVISGEAVRTFDGASARCAGATQHEASARPLPLQPREAHAPRGQEHG
jgi:hypothetical protein